LKENRYRKLPQYPCVLLLVGPEFSTMAEVTAKNISVTAREKVQGAESTLLGLLVLGANGWFIWWIAPDKYAYVFSNNISPSNDYVEDRLTNCHFLHAPIGDKDCHYDKHSQSGARLPLR
jgi:hypothetical protein